MSPAVRRARILAGVFCGVGVIVMVPWIGWWPLAMFALVPVPLVGLDRLMAKTARPERLVAASLLLHTSLMLVGVGITGGVHSPLLPWVAIPVVTAAARFRLPVFLSGAVLATAGLIGVAAISSPHSLIHDPAPVIAIVVLLAALVVAQQPLLDAEFRWRRDAVLDPLTGLLNRQQLKQRFREVAEQARLAQRSVSVVILDLDHFKELNDTHGHAHGDAVLREVAYLLRKELRAFELLYRIGGEELLLVLPGADLTETIDIAERVRAEIEAAKPGGLTITASFGVCSAAPDQLEFDRIFRAADEALYAAKHAGRNLVAYIPPDQSGPTVAQRETVAA